MGRLGRLRAALGRDSPPPPAFPSGWDDWHRRRLAAERCFVPWVEAVRPLAGRTVLEYGAGNGAVSAAFAPRAGRYVGLDIDADQVAVARRLLAEGGLEPTLVVAPPDRILAEAAAFRGEVDVFLCYAVLEHMSVEERLALLALAREVVRPDGILVIAETPNRLTPWDYHTSQLPFLNQLPEELALRYVERSPRRELVAALQAAGEAGEGARREAFVRWGRGMSYHELELVFEDLPRHVVASSGEPVLAPEREVHRAELALQRALDAARPDLPAAFSRYWLDLILTPHPQAQPPRALRPWALRTAGSRLAAYDAGEVISMPAAEATLLVELPVASARLVVGVQGAGELVARSANGAERRGRGELVELRFPAPGTRYELALSAPGWITLVLYEG